MIKRIDKNKNRKNRRIRVRNKISGTSARPRLNVYRSLNHIYAQIIDDNAGHTLASASTLSAEIAKVSGKTKQEEAFLVGELIAKLALDKGIKTVVFDRAGYVYTGRVKAVAEGARSAGLEF